MINNKKIRVEEITWIWDGINDTCEMITSDNSQKLTVNGITNKGGKWYQIGEEKHHWISFNPDKFNPNNWEVFYKRIVNDEEGEQITYYRQYFTGIESDDQVLFFTFSQFDEWIRLNGKWQSKYNENK